jgi:hypothetical protein
VSSPTDFFRSALIVRQIHRNYKFMPLRLASIGIAAGRAAVPKTCWATRSNWLNYFSIGGAVGEYEVEAYLQGLLSLPRLQRDLLAMAANELIDAVPRLRAPYADDLTETPSARQDNEEQDTSGSAPSEGANNRGPGEQEPG